jgi:RNA polymerase sigma-B factor
VTVLDRPVSIRSPDRPALATKLAEYHRTRDQRLRSDLVEAYQGYAAALASRFSRHREAQDDLTQAALIGLLNAIDRFDPDRGVEFTTFAWATIMGELKRHFRDRTWSVRVPRSLQEAYLQTSDAVDELTTELGRSPTISEIAERLGVSEENVVEAMEVRGAYRLSSLDAPVDHDDTRTVQVAEEDDGMAGVEDQQLLSPLLSRLPVRERRILQLRFVHDLTQAEIAKQLGISQMHVSRLLSRSLAQLHEWAGESESA